MINVSYFTFWPQRYGRGSGRLYVTRAEFGLPGKHKERHLD